MGRKCSVCEEAEFKYKCPACLSPYCSVACFKNHKENLCQKPQPLPPVQETEKNESAQPTRLVDTESFELNVEVKSHSRRTIEVEEESYIVSKDRLYSLAECKEIRDALKSNELQEMILRVDNSEEPEQELDKAMTSGYFHDFFEKVLDNISQRDVEVLSGSKNS